MAGREAGVECMWGDLKHEALDGVKLETDLNGGGEKRGEDLKLGEI